MRFDNLIHKRDQMTNRIVVYEYFLRPRTKNNVFLQLSQRLKSGQQYAFTLVEKEIYIITTRVLQKHRKFCLDPRNVSERV